MASDMASHGTPGRVLGGKGRGQGDRSRPRLPSPPQAAVLPLPGVAAWGGRWGLGTLRSECAARTVVSALGSTAVSGAPLSCAVGTGEGGAGRAHCGSVKGAAVVFPWSESAVVGRDVIGWSERAPERRGAD